jgi:hypothetical protein
MVSSTLTVDEENLSYLAVLAQFTIGVSRPMDGLIEPLSPAALFHALR